MGIWVVSTFWVLWKMLFWTFVYSSHFERCQSCGREVGLWGWCSFSCCLFTPLAPIDKNPPAIVLLGFCRVFLLEAWSPSCSWFSLSTSVPCCWAQEYENGKATLPCLSSPTIILGMLISQCDFHSNSCSFFTRHMIFLVLSSHQKSYFYQELTLYQGLYRNYFT